MLHDCLINAKNTSYGERRLIVACNVKKVCFKKETKTHYLLEIFSFSKEYGGYYNQLLNSTCLSPLIATPEVLLSTASYEDFVLVTPEEVLCSNNRIWREYYATKVSKGIKEAIFAYFNELVDV